MALRVITRTVKSGRVSFNQVVMEQQPPPPGLLLVAVDPDAGLYVWMKSHDAVAPHTVAQAPGYSRALPPVEIAAPPSFLGDPVFFSKESIDGWGEIAAGRTNTLNSEIRKLFGIAG